MLKNKLIGHTTYGSVLDDLKVPAHLLSAFKAKAELLPDILRVASRYTQAQLQVILHEPQPRISDLMRGKLARFSLDKLVHYADLLGIRMEIKTNIEQVRIPVEVGRTFSAQRQYAIKQKQQMYARMKRTDSKIIKAAKRK